MPRPPRKRKTTPSETAAPAAPASSAAKRWRWALHQDGVSIAPVRMQSRRQGERQQALADLYGNTPMLSTGDRLLPITSVLAEVLSRLDVQEAQLAPELLNEAWKRAVGAFLAGQSQLISLVNGVAGVRTSHPAVRFELQRNKKIIIQALNAALGEGSVHDMRVNHG